MQCEVPSSAGPLLYGGITVFSPMLENDVKPVHRVGVIGIGGLGHLVQNTQISTRTSGRNDKT